MAKSHRPRKRRVRIKTTITSTVIQRAQRYGRCMERELRYRDGRLVRTSAWRPCAPV